MKKQRNVGKIKKPLSIENLSVNYGDTSALIDVSIDVEENEYLGIIGPNGGGKTTLLKAILGLVEILSGAIYIYGEKSNKKRHLIGYVPQIASTEKNFPATVHEVVLMGRLNPNLKLLHRYKKDDIEKTNEILNRVGIYNLRGKSISELSGGEFQKMLIARALAIDPKLLLLDEPTASVDANSKKQIFDLLGELNHNMTIILVTHDMLAISSFVNSLACLNKELVYHGSPEINKNVVDKLYGCPIDLIAHGVPHRVLREHGKE